MPTKGVRESLEILKTRQKPEHLNPDFNEIFLADNRFFDLAKYVIYTEGKTAEETCRDVMQVIGMHLE